MNSAVKTRVKDWNISARLMTTLIHNARIWRSGIRNSSKSDRFYNWILFDNKSGKITSCGSNKDPIPVEKDLQKVDLGGKWVLPGFHDAHIHVFWHGMLTSKYTNLDSPKSIQQMQERLKVMLNDPHNTPKDGNSWFVGFGFEQGEMGRYPTAEDLDAIGTDRPLLIYHSGLHIALFNTVGLELTSVDYKSIVKNNDELDVYPEGHKMAGKPNGIVKEALLDRIKKVVPRSSELIKSQILSALDDCVRLGITSVHCLDGDCWNEFAELGDKGKLPIQCYFSVFYDDLKDGKNTPKKSGEKHGPMVKCSCVKIFTDGALGSDTAGLSLPYKKKDLNEKDNYGIFYYTQQELDRMVKEVNDHGFQLEIHVIGDKAAEMAVDALEKAGITPDKRPILVHCQVLSMDLVKRMAKLGVVASIQPQSVPGDARWARDKLPDELQSCMYAYRTLLENGVICAGSSDSPAYYPSSLTGIHDAIFQPDFVEGQGSSQYTSHRAKTDRCFQPQERVTFSQAIDMYTSEAAKTDFAENEIGRLEPGFFANFVVLDVPVSDGEPMDISDHPQVLLDTKVAQTWARGVKLFDAQA